jgi:hypothetical protein
MMNTSGTMSERIQHPLINIDEHGNSDGLQHWLRLTSRLTLQLEGSMRVEQQHTLVCSETQLLRADGES